jgi:hypothetical protein
MITRPETLRIISAIEGALNQRLYSLAQIGSVII